MTGPCQIKEKSLLIKKLAAECGFSACGISKATKLLEEEKYLKKHINRGRNALSAYLEKNIDKRSDPRILVPGAKSVISLLLNYYPQEKQNPACTYKIGKYAYGKDYHLVIKKMLKTLGEKMEEDLGTFAWKAFTDTAPVMEKAWASRAGLGWIGKNTLLINPDFGSYCCIGEIVCDLDLAYDTALPERCGTCTLCLDACPSRALSEAYILDARKCISFQTIEAGENAVMPEENLLWIYGCDICQDVCPYNHKPKAHNVIDFQIMSLIKDYQDEDWENLGENLFNSVFAQSNMLRTGYRKIIQNIEAVKKNRLLNRF
jgi:epoxyqueuosine reductase